MSPVVVLRIRAEARAMLFGAGLFPTIEEAMAPLLAYADDIGLVRSLGQSMVEGIILEPFKPYIIRN